MAALSALLIAPVLRAADGPGSGADLEKPRPTQMTPGRHPEPTYSVTAGLDGEIYPVFANFASLQKPQERTSGTVVVRIGNHTDQALRNRVSVRVRGWSDEEIQTVEMTAGESKTLLFAPTFLPRAFNNREIMPATVVVTVSDAAGHAVFATTAPVRMRSVDDMYWGPGFKYARYIASWVTPHDPAVEAVLMRAKEFMPGRRLPGYEPWKSAAEQKDSTLQQMRAIYKALQEKGLSYVKSSITFGDHSSMSERIRMPYESLEQVSANCIDGVVMYAALFENLGMDSAVVLVPGHAYVAVRAAQTGDAFLYLDTALTGRASFEEALRNAENGLAKLPSKDVMRVMIPDSRNAGIYPMPSPDTESGLHNAVTAARGQ